MKPKNYSDKLKRFLTMALAFVMVFGAMMPLSTERAHAFSGKVGSKYTVHDGGQITYGSGAGGYSNSRKCDLEDDLGSRYSYCVQPAKASPATGTVTVDKVITDEDDKGKWNALRNIIYYSPSYPGYDKNVKDTGKNEIVCLMLSTDADIIIIDPEREYAPLVRALGGSVIEISATSPNHINAMDMSKDYGESNPVIEKSQFLQSLCEQIIAGHRFSKGQQSIIDRCTENVYRFYQQGNYMGTPPTLQDFREELLKQPEPEAHSLALELELFTRGSLNTFAQQTNVNTDNRLVCYDILELGEQLRAIGMLVILDSIINRITANRMKGKQTFIFIDEIYPFIYARIFGAVPVQAVEESP